METNKMVTIPTHLFGSLKVSDYLDTPKYTYQGDPRDGALAELCAAGFKAPKSIPMASRIRMSVTGDKTNQKSGWAIYYESADYHDPARRVGVLVYGSWRGMPEKAVWSSKSNLSMSAEEQLTYAANIESARLIQEEETRKRQLATAEESLQLLSEYPDATGNEVYLARKGIGAAPGVKISRDALVIPVFDASGLTGMQYIPPAGGKAAKFKSGTKSKDAFFKIEGDSNRVFIAEGYATGKTIHELTGNTVYICFYVGNIYGVTNHVRTQHNSSIIVVAADNDRNTPGNPGLTKAKQASDGLGVGLAVPMFAADGDGTDFNDLMLIEGKDAARAILNYQAVPYKNPPPESRLTENLPGVLGDLVSYYHATAGEIQPGFAMQSAIALCSVVLGRHYCTNLNNYSMLYLLNVGKSATGKEHAKTVVEKVLEAAGLSHLSAADGYSSGSAVFSMLYEKPRHLAVIDEFSKYLKAAKKDMNPHGVTASSELLKVYTLASGTLRPKAVTLTGLAADKKKELVSRQVVSPHITVLGMTTPEIFDTIKLSDIKDGFINRFLIHVSDAPRRVRVHKEPLQVPECILNWIRAVEARRGALIDLPNERPSAQILTVTEEAVLLQQKNQEELIEIQNGLDSKGMAEIVGRCNEIGMRLALIAALARDPMGQFVEATDMQWGLGYSRKAFERLVGEAKMSISGSDFEANKLEVLKMLRENGPITVAAMQKTKPYSKFTKRDLREIIDGLLDAEAIEEGQLQTGKRGRPTTMITAVE